MKTWGNGLAGKIILLSRIISALRPHESLTGCQLSLLILDRELSSLARDYVPSLLLGHTFLDRASTSSAAAVEVAASRYGGVLSVEQYTLAAIAPLKAGGLVSASVRENRLPDGCSKIQIEFRPRAL